MAPAPRVSEVVATVIGAGAALFPVDPGLPGPALRRLLERGRPTHRLGDAGSIEPVGGGIACDRDVALIVATSGATGDPRLVELDRTAVDAAVGASVSALGATVGDAWLSCLPLHHVGGLLVLLRAMTLGAPLMLHHRFDVEAFSAAVSDGRARFSSVVPTMAARLLDADVDVSTMSAILVGGGPVPEALRARLQEHGGSWVTTYGQTQSCGGVVYDGVPLPGVETRIGAGAEVELVGPTLMRGYRLDERATCSAFTGDGWLRTGDAGHLDEEGRLHVDGRLDELIVTGGENVWPAAVEAVLVTHPAVADVAVTGRPDPEWGSRVVALVVPADAQSPPALSALREHVAARLPRHAAPRELVIVPGLPRTALGKLRRGGL